MVEASFPSCTWFIVVWGGVSWAPQGARRGEEPNGVELVIGSIKGI